MAFPKVGLRAVIEGLARFNRDTRLINQRLKEVTGNVKKTEKASRNLGKTIEAWDGPLRKAQFALFGLAAAGGAFLVKATLLAARVETLGVVTETLGKNVGKTKDEIRALEEAVTSQGITLRGARTAIALMIQSNIDLSNAVDLAAEAQNAAVIAGINSTEAFQRLVFVITSGNVRMARTLGLQVSFQEAYEKTATALDKTTLELSQQEKVQARTQAVLAAGINIQDAYNAAMETTGKKLTSLPRLFENVTVAMGEGYLPVLSEAVDGLTAFLKGIDESTVAQKRGLSATLGTVTALSAMGGASVFLIRKLPALITLLQGVGAASLAAGGAVLALIAILVQLAVVGARAKAENESLRITFKELAREVIDQSQNFRVYERRAFEAAEGTIAFEAAQRLAERTGMSFHEALRLILRDEGLLTKESFEAAEAAHELGFQSAFGAEKISEIALNASRAKGPVEDLGDAEEIAAKKAQDFADAQQAVVDQIQRQIDTDITPEFTGFQEEFSGISEEIDQIALDKIEALAKLEADAAEATADHADRIEDLTDRRQDERRRLDDLNDSLEIAKIRLSEMNDETSESSRLAQENRIGDISEDIVSQRESIGDLTTEIGELQGQTDDMVAAQGQAMADLKAEYSQNLGERVAEIDEVTKAWSRQTAEILFNLATQQLGIDGFTTEETALLRELAGPNGLGLIDEAGVALLEGLEDLNAALERPGDQVPLITDAFNSIASAMVDPTQKAGDLAGSIRDIIDASLELSNDPFISSLLERGLEPANFPGGFIRRHRGGDVRRGEPYLVGKSGSEELFVPNQSGMILPQSLAQIPVSGAQTSISNSTTEQNFNMTIHSQAQREQIEADFNLLALRGERRG